MLISKKKREENIAEYLLYMWQIEDVIRAYKLNLDAIKNNVIARSGLDEQTQNDYAEWYGSLIEMMRQEGVTESGHLQINKNVLIALAELHNGMLKMNTKFAEYVAEFYRTLPYIVELRSKAGDDKKGELETCFNALYGMLLMRIQKREIAAETQLAMAQIAKFIGLLAAYYNKDKEKPILVDDEDL